MISLTKFTTGNPATAQRFNIPLLDADTNFLSVESALASIGAIIEGLTSRIEEIEENPAGGGTDLPIGTILLFGSSSIPDDFLRCDGSSLAVDGLYNDLFLIIGYNYGGSGEAFNLPNLLGRCPIGYGSGDDLTQRILGESGGDEEHTLSVSELPAHKHTVSTFAYSSASTKTITGGFYTTAFGTNDTSEVGEGGAHNNMSPFLATNFIIKYL